MIHFSGNLKHDGGRIDLEVYLDGDQTVLRFGNSFTLRLEEDQLTRLCDVIMDALNAQRSQRRNAAKVVLDEAGEISMSDLQAAEDVFVQLGIDAREKLKAKRKSELWDPDDPANW